METKQWAEEILFNRFFVQVFEDSGIFRFKVSDDLKKESDFSGAASSRSECLAVARRFAIARNARQ